MASQMEKGLKNWSDLGVKPRLPAIDGQRSPKRTPAGPSEAVVIDYEALARLNSIRGLRGDSYDTSIRAHDTFVAQVGTMIKQPSSPWEQRLQRSKQLSRRISKFRRDAHSEAAAAGYGKRVKESNRRRSMNAVISSRPFERSPDDVAQLSAWLADRFALCAGLPRAALHAVVETAWHESYEEPGLALAGDYVDELTGLVLRGSVSVALGDEGSSSGDAERTTVSTNQAFGSAEAPCRDILTDGPTTVLLFNRKVMDTALAEITAADCEAKFNVLSKVPELMQWAPSALRDVGPLFRWATQKAGDLFVAEGRRASSFAIIASGRCGIYRDVDAGPSAGGKRRIQRVHVGSLGPGGCLGEVSVLGALPKGARRLSQRTSIGRCSVGPSAGSLVEPYTAKFLETSKLLVIDSVKAKGKPLHSPFSPHQCWLSWLNSNINPDLVIHRT